MPSWSQKNRGEKFSSWFLHRNLLGRVTNRDRTSCGSRRKNSKLAQTTGTVDFLIRVRAFRDSLRGELPHVQIIMKDGPNPLTWDAQLPSYWFSRNTAVFQDYFMNLINNLRGGHSFGTSKTRRFTGRNITTFKLGNPLFDSGLRW